MYKSIIIIMIVELLSISISYSQIKNAKTETVKVYGNCSMCETSIKMAGYRKKVSAVNWNEKTKIATIAFDSNKTDLDAILKSIALAGYDNQSFLAPDAAYNKLPDCCKYKREMKQMVIVTSLAKDATESVKNDANHQHAEMSNNVQETNQLTAVFVSYFALKDALVKTDRNTASVKSKDLESAINEVKMDNLQMNVHTVWMKVLNDLKEDAEHINRAKDIARQREHFMNLSKNMYELIKVVKPAETVYYQFCPMANDGKGANWLSKEKGVKNPYYGSKMLTCGKTVETIKQ